MPVVWLVAVALFATIGLLLAGNHFVSRDIIDLWAARGTTPDGVWLSSILIEALNWLPEVWAQEVLSWISGAVAGLGLALLFQKLRRNEWPAWQALTLVALLGCNALILYAVTAANSAIPWIFACALVIPNIRRLESVGDVQAEMGFGLVLPLFLLAGPETAPLVPLLAAASAFSNHQARRDWRAFIAMFLVAILPSLIVLAGLLTINFEHHRAFADFVAPYFASYVGGGSSNGIVALLCLVVFAPVTVLPILYCLAPDRRMKPLSALAVIALPLYLTFTGIAFGCEVNAWTPAAALLACFCTWAAVSRLRQRVRLTALALMALSLVTSWAFSDVWADADWKQALWGHAPGRPAQACNEASARDAACDGLHGRIIWGLLARRAS